CEVATMVASATRSSLSACHMLTAPSGKSVSSASSPMAITRIAIRASITVMPDRRVMTGPSGGPKALAPARGPVASHPRSRAVLDELILAAGHLVDRLADDVAGLGVHADQDLLRRPRRWRRGRERQGRDGLDRHPAPVLQLCVVPRGGAVVNPQDDLAAGRPV